MSATAKSYRDVLASRDGFPIVRMFDAPAADAILAVRARLVGDALVTATECDPSDDVRQWGRWLASNASNVTLAQLGRLIR